MSNTPSKKHHDLAPIYASFPLYDPILAKSKQTSRPRKGVIWKAVNPRKFSPRSTQAQGGPKEVSAIVKGAQVRLPTLTQRITTRLTPLAGPSPVASARAVADEAVPAILAHGVVLAGVAVTLLGAHPRAGGLDARGVLHFRQLPDVLAAPVDEQVADAAHVAIVEHGGPELGGEDEASAVLRQPAQVHVPLQVEDLALPAGGERGAPAVH